MQNYKIMVLGPAGSGKTVFLGSMYKQLTMQKEDIGFFLSAERRQEIQLNAIYRQVVSPDEEWPRATQYRDINQWQFSCDVRTAQNIYSAFQFTYLDYAGERLTDIHLEDENLSPEFEQALKEADVYLGLLDGRKILEFMHEESKAGKFLFRDLPSILSVMRRAVKPVYFVITKWDLLEGRYTFSQVRDRLLEIPDLRDFIPMATGKSTIRLIPVSSVGSGFAELLSDGQMRKRPGTFPQPFQVEMPMACALIDLFKERLEAIQKE